jgi:hypothetical protein
MRHLSAILLVLFLAVLPSCKYFKNGGLFGKKKKALALMLARQDSVRVADSLRNVQEQLMALENAKQDSIRKADEERKAMQSKYNIIVGAFITPEYAKALTAEYKNKGYNAQIIPMTGSKFELVAAESHKDFRQAVKRLKAFQDTVLIDTWMYVRQ